VKNKLEHRYPTSKDKHDKQRLVLSFFILHSGDLTKERRVESGPTQKAVNLPGLHLDLPNVVAA